LEILKEGNQRKSQSIFWSRFLLKKNLSSIERRKERRLLLEEGRGGGGGEKSPFQSGGEEINYVLEKNLPRRGLKSIGIIR